MQLTSKSTQTHKHPQHLPIRRRARHNREYRANHQTKVKRNLAAHNICRQAPKQRADEHAHVRGDGEAVGVRGAEFERGLAGDDGLDEQDERVDGVAEAVEDEDCGWVLGRGLRGVDGDEEGRTYASIGIL